MDPCYIYILLVSVSEGKKKGEGERFLFFFSFFKENGKKYRLYITSLKPLLKIFSPIFFQKSQTQK